MKISRKYPFWSIILTGYLTLGRTFAYVGVPPLFIGEVYLGVGILRNRRNWVGSFVDDFFRFKPLAVTIGLTLLWGAFEVFRALFMGRSPVEVLRIFAFNYYPIYVLFGIAIGRDVTLPQFIRLFKITAVIYTICGIVETAGADIGAFLPAIAALITVLILALWPYLRDWWPRYLVLVLSAFPCLSGSGRGRGAVLGFLAGTAAVALTSRANLVRMTMIVLTIITSLYFLAPLLPADQDWAAPLDPVSHFAGLLATYYPDQAAKMMRRRGHIRQADVILVNEGTASWRREIWHNALNSLSSPELKLLGHGGGASLQDLTPDGAEIHTPHNFTIFAIYYQGWVCLGLFGLFLMALLWAGRGLSDPCLRTATCAAIWTSLMVAVTGNCYETPGGAVPLYLLCGILIGVDANRTSWVCEQRRKHAAELEAEDLPEAAYAPPGNPRRQAQAGFRTPFSAPVSATGVRRPGQRMGSPRGSSQSGRT